MIVVITTVFQPPSREEGVAGDVQVTVCASECGTTTDAERLAASIARVKQLEAKKDIEAPIVNLTLTECNHHSAFAHREWAGGPRIVISCPTCKGHWSAPFNR
jgi:hypothetical protein